MKITEQEIKIAALNQNGDAHVFSPELQSFIKGANWALSQMEPEWVAVTEGYPEKTMNVIIYGRYTRDCPKRTHEALFVRKGNNPNYWHFSIGGIKSKDVTHWMPLPLAPQ